MPRAALITLLAQIEKLKLIKCENVQGCSRSQGNSLANSVRSSDSKAFESLAYPSSQVADLEFDQKTRTMSIGL